MNFATAAVLLAVLLLAALAVRSIVRCPSREEEGGGACCGCALKGVCGKKRT